MYVYLTSGYCTFDEPAPPRRDGTNHKVSVGAAVVAGRGRKRDMDAIAGGERRREGGRARGPSTANSAYEVPTYLPYLP